MSKLKKLVSQVKETSKKSGSNSKPKRSDKEITNYLKAVLTDNNYLDEFSDEEKKNILKIVAGLHGELSGQMTGFTSGGHVEHVAIQLKNGKWIEFSNIAESVAVSKKKYATEDEYYEAFMEDDENAAGLMTSTNDESFESVDEIISQIKNGKLIKAYAKGGDIDDGASKKTTEEVLRDLVDNGGVNNGMEEFISFEILSTPFNSKTYKNGKAKKMAEDKMKQWKDQGFVTEMTEKKNHKGDMVYIIYGVKKKDSFVKGGLVDYDKLKKKKLYELKDGPYKGWWAIEKKSKYIEKRPTETEALVVFEEEYGTKDQYAKGGETENAGTSVDAIINKFKHGFKSISELKSFFQALYDLDIAFHPDDDFKDTVNTKTSKETFTESEGDALNDIMGKAFEYCEKEGFDVYQIAGDVQVDEWEKRGFYEKEDADQLRSMDDFYLEIGEGAGKERITYTEFIKANSGEDVTPLSENDIYRIKALEVGDTALLQDVPFGESIKRISEEEYNAPNKGDQVTFKPEAVDRSKWNAASHLKKLYAQLKKHANDVGEVISVKHGAANVKFGDTVLSGIPVEALQRLQSFAKGGSAGLSREELGKMYEDVVGYNIAEDDPEMSATEIISMMKEYDEESAKNKEGRPFAEKGAYGYADGGSLMESFYGEDQSKVEDALKEIDELGNKWNGNDDRKIFKNYEDFLDKEAPFKDIINKSFLEHNKKFSVNTKIKDENGFITAIYLEIPKEMKGEDKYLYRINNSQFHSMMGNNIDDEIKNTERTIQKGLYKEKIPSLHEMMKVWLKMLKVKKANPYVGFSDYKFAEGGEINRLPDEYYAAEKIRDKVGMRSEPITKEEFEEWAKLKNIELIKERDGFHVGQKVTFTNDYGVVFPNLTIVGISKDDSFYGRSIYINSDSFWFPHKPSELTPE